MAQVAQVARAIARGSPATGGWPDWSCWSWAALLPLALMSGGDSSSSSSKKAVQAGQKFPATLAEVPTNNVTGDGNAKVQLDGRKLTATVNTNGLLDPAVHPMHIHAGGEGRCAPCRGGAQPRRSPGDQHGRRRAVLRPARDALTTTGDTSKQSILVFSRFPHIGNINYTRTFDVPAKTARLIRDAARPR